MLTNGFQCVWINRERERIFAHGQQHIVPVHDVSICSSPNLIIYPRIRHESVVELSKERLASSPFNDELIGSDKLHLVIRRAFVEASSGNNTVAVEINVIIELGFPFLVRHGPVVGAVDSFWDYPTRFTIVNLSLETTWPLRALINGVVVEVHIFGH